MLLLFIITRKVNDTENNPFNIKLTNQYTNGLGNLKLILLQNLSHNRKNYTHYIYKLDFEKGKLTNKDIVSLRLQSIQINKGQSFIINIDVDKKNKNNYFLYDFDLKKIYLSDLHLSKYEQFNLFKDAISARNFCSENAEKDLLIDSIDNLIDKDNNFSLELLLEVLDFYYKKKEGKFLDKYLEDKWDYVYNCKKLNSYYNNFLSELQEKIFKQFKNQSNGFCNIYTEILINLILIYRAQYEKEKIQEMLQRKFYWFFIPKIIVRKLDFYLNLGIELPIGLINKMLGQKNLTLDKILKLLSFGSSVSEILKMINDNFNILYNSCKQNNYIIIMHDFQDKEYIDNIEELKKNINELIEKEKKIKYFFVSFDEEFWLYYISYYKKDFKKLKIIESIILSYCNMFCSNLDINNLSYIIHENEIKLIKKLGLKNEKILDFFEENYIKGNNNNSNIKFPFYFLDEIDLETADDKFFNKWKEMDMISYILNDKYNFIKIMLDKITKIEYFGKIFNFFKNNKERKLLENDTIENLMNKFRELMKNYNINKCNNFIYDSCFLIHLIDSYKKDSVNYLDSVILQEIDSNEIKTNIFCNLLSYPYLSINLISFIIRYYLRNMNIQNGSGKIKIYETGLSRVRLNDKIEELIIRKLNDKHYTQVIKLIFEDLNKLIISKEELFNEEENIEFFIFLKKIQKLIDYQKYDLSKYIKKIINFKDQIINDLKNGNIKYDLIHSWLTDNEKKKLLIERLNILSFYNTKEINDCFKSLENDFNKIYEDVKKAKKLKEILKVFFPKEQQRNIEYINNYENELKDKLLKEAKKNFDISYFIKDLNLNEMDKLKSSKIFLSILNTKKGENQNNNGIEAFKCAQKDYNKLRNLLGFNWENHIIEIIEEFHFKKLSDNEIEEEFFILKNYFEMTDISESEVINRKNRLIFIMKKKEEIICNLTNSFHFILEFVAEHIINNLNNLKDTIAKNINIEMINKYNNNNLIEKYFHNLSENYSSENIVNNQINQLIQELNTEKENNRILRNQIQSLEFRISQNNFNRQRSYATNDNRRFSIIRPEEKIIAITFETIDQKIKKCFPCKNTDVFVDLEKELYNEYNEFKDIETYLICNGNKVFRFKTLEENGITNSSTIYINKIDDE